MVDAQGSTLDEYDPDNKLVSIDDDIIEHASDLLRGVLSNSPEGRSLRINEGKMFCVESVRIKYAMCRALCGAKGFMEYMLCKSVMLTRYLSGCLSGNIECYGDTGSMLPTTQGPGPRPTTQRPRPPNMSGNCGISPDGVLRVTGGNEVTKNDRYPWQVGLSLNSGNLDYVCSGTVITRKHILTAAHCFDNGETYTVGFGSADESKPRFEKRQNRFILHENYNRATKDNNIAIIEFSNPIDLDREAISPICLPGNDNSNLRLTAIISGWGGTSSANPSTSVTKLHEGSVQIDTCPDTSSYTDNMICTTSPSVDACKGDGGGPIIISNDGRYQQVGIISHGTSGACGTPGSTAVYTNVGKYLNWINTKVSPETTYR